MARKNKGVLEIMNNDKKDFYDKYWWIPLVTSIIALLISILRIKVKM